jgi:hypothetical protein
MKALVLISITTLLAGAAVGCKKKEEKGASGAPAAAKAGDKAAAHPASYGIPDCDAYVAAMAKFVTCKELPPEQQELYGKDFERRRATLLEASQGDGARKTAEGEVCKQALGELVEGAKYRGCPI